MPEQAAPCPSGQRVHTRIEVDHIRAHVLRKVVEDEWGEWGVAASGLFLLFLLLREPADPKDQQQDG
jgi:hypothetical protein